MQPVPPQVTFGMIFLAVCAVRCLPSVGLLGTFLTDLPNWVPGRGCVFVTALKCRCVKANSCFTEECRRLGAPRPSAGSLGAGLRWLHLEASSAQSQGRTGWAPLQAWVAWVGPLCPFLPPAAELDKRQPS